MNIEDLKSKIEFQITDDGPGIKKLTAQIVFTHCTIYEEKWMDKDALDHMREVSRERILRLLYDDLRRELYDAIMDFQKANPYDGQARQLAIEKLIKAARCQPPDKSAPVVPQPKPFTRSI